MTTPGSPARRTNTKENGSVTAEFAIGLPGVVAIILLGLSALVAGATYIECQEAARAGAREAMLVGAPDSGAQTARLVAGDRAEVITHVEGQWVTVTVSKALFASFFPIRVSATMAAPLEGG